MNDLYRQDIHNCFHNAADNPTNSFSFDDSVLKESLKRIYSEDFNPMTDIEENLFNEFWKKLNQATEEGFGNYKYVDPEYAFLEELRYNNGVFAAFKTHRMQNDMAALLLDENGSLKPFNQWLNDVQPIANHQCWQWFRTEYDMAVTRAHQAADWQQFEAEKDVLPNLEWLKSTSIHPGEDHRVFWGVIRPVDDPAWNEHRPGDRWGCKCRLRATNKPSNSQIIGSLPKLPLGVDEPASGLKGNPGITGAIFDQSHPYFQHTQGDKEIIALASDKLMTKQSREDVRNFFKEELKGEARKYTVASGEIDLITISYQDIKTITGKPHKYGYLKNSACYYLPEILKKMDYLGYSPDFKDATIPGHADAERWHYFRFTLNGEDSFLVVKENAKGENRIHSIQDKEHFDVRKIKNPWKKR